MKGLNFSKFFQLYDTMKIVIEKKLEIEFKCSQLGKFLT